jgi:transcription initiation factor IIF auxiliary subunit
LSRWQKAVVRQRSEFTRSASARTTIASLLRGLLLVGSLVVVGVVPTQAAAQISAANVSRYVGNGRWVWTVFINASPQVLDHISCVVYMLHPSFKEPIVQVCSRGDPRFPFGYSANGWGVFQIGVSVYFKDGSRTDVTHMLTFEQGELRLRTRNVATQVRPGLWDWTVFIEGDEDQLSQVQCVQYTLHPTFPDPVRTVCERGSGPRAFPLSASGWGTFQITVRIMTKDGKTYELKHDLAF